MLGDRASIFPTCISRGKIFSLKIKSWLAVKVMVKYLGHEKWPLRGIHASQIYIFFLLRVVETWDFEVKG